ncbi:hypothetical protein C9439_07795 [archaeon SCG-AAA382B04]|nr:hypothetical protein C9439_07795 [archaeon SCG-AAA382B04]
MNELYYLLAANLITWIILFGYMYYITTKQNRIKEKIRVLERNE